MVLMAPYDYENPNSTGYEYFNPNSTVIRYASTGTYREIEIIQKSKIQPIWLKGRKNKRDNFKLK